MDDKRITCCTLYVKRQDDNKQRKKENCEWYVKAGEPSNGQRWRMWRVWMPDNIDENKTVANYMSQMWLIKMAMGIYLAKDSECHTRAPTFRHEDRRLPSSSDEHLTGSYGMAVMWPATCVWCGLVVCWFPHKMPCDKYHNLSLEH